MTAMLLILLLMLLFGHSSAFELSYNPKDYLEVYPDPSDPEVLQGRIPLHFSLLQSLGGEFSEFDATGVVLGVKVALDRINNDTSMLPGYTLHYILDNSKCNRTIGLDVFHSQLFQEPTKLSIIGSGCSLTTEPTAEISHYYNISHISCISSSILLRNRRRFPYYFQLLRTDDSIAIGFYGIIKEYGWRRVLLLVQDEEVFTTSMEVLKKLLDQDGVEYTEMLFNSSSSIDGLRRSPFDSDSRIYLLSMYQVHANAFLCDAYHRRIAAPQYVLLTIAWYNRFWWRLDRPDLNCTAEQRRSVLPSTLAVTADVILNEIDGNNFTTTPGISALQYFAEERKFLGMPPLNASYDDYSQFCHDATWMLAYALNKTIMSLSDSAVNDDISATYNITPPFGLEDFTYRNQKLLDIIFGHLQNTSFDGVTGPLMFGDQGIRTDVNLTVFQYRNIKNDTDLVKIGGVQHSTGEFAYVTGESIGTVWEGSRIPYDGVPRKEIVTLHPALTVIFITAGCAGIIFAVVCLIFNVVYRNTKLIKLASTKLNYLIGIGAIVVYMDIFFFVIPTTNRNVVNAFCNVTIWLTAIGYSLCFGTILVKMTRVYYIFTNPAATKKRTKDRFLVLGVAFLVAIDLILLVTYTVLVDVVGNNASRLVPHQNFTRIDGEFEILINNCVYICDSKTRDILLGILYGYKMLLQVIGLFLAFSIRKVKVKGLNDAKYIAAAIYVTSVVLAMIIVANYSLQLINVVTALLCTGFLVGTSVILILVFVPQMVGLYKDPKGETIFVTTSAGVSEDARPSIDEGKAGLLQKIRDLEDEVKDIPGLRRRITELEKEKADAVAKDQSDSTRTGSESRAISDNSSSTGRIEASNTMFT